jgi:hypothetical protein
MIIRLDIPISFKITTPDTVKVIMFLNHEHFGIYAAKMTAGLSQT